MGKGWIVLQDEGIKGESRVIEQRAPFSSRTGFCLSIAWRIRSVSKLILDAVL